MLFNSFEFLVFFPIVCLIYYALGKNKYRNPFLLMASYYFYMNWKPVYALLILTSTVLTYLCGLLVERFQSDKRKKKLFLTLSLLINFSILFIFKYYNFINDSVWEVMSSLGIQWSVPNFDLLLPVGISFYTFQAVGYTIDVYRGTIPAEKNFFTYALFVSFFPQLVAGPIERATNLLPQFHKEHTLEYDNVSEGFKQMLWGFFMKLCVADRLSEYVDAVYNNVDQHNGTSLLLATIFFTFQIYCDFGGYSNIAIGAAKIMGYNLMENFHRPYFSLSVKEFWKRWHISLSTWFMDYVYIPLGGSRVKYGRHLANLMITFLVSGIWHGANWTFVLWGALHGAFLIIDNVFRKYIYQPKNETLPARLFSMALCFVLAAFAWIFFRANNVHDAFTVVGKILTERGPLFNDIMTMIFGGTSLMVLIFKDLKDEFKWNVHFMHSNNLVVRCVCVILLLSYIMQMAAFEGGQFIYFQF